MPKKAKEEYNVYTSTDGLEFVSATKDVQLTTKNIVRVCRLLDRNFGDGYIFRPELISEGGIQMISWPGKSKGGDEYKSMRFIRKNGTTGNWPFIRGSAIEASMEWEISDETSILVSAEKKKLSFAFFLKAFHGAPQWTKEELEKVVECFAEIGLSKKGRIPSNKSLKKIGDLGARKAIL